MHFIKIKFVLKSKFLLKLIKINLDYTFCQKSHFLFNSTLTNINLQTHNPSQINSKYSPKLGGYVCTNDAFA